MRLLKTASGKKKIKLSKSEWVSIGKTAGWMREAQSTTKMYFILGDTNNGEIINQGEFDYSGDPNELDMKAKELVGQARWDGNSSYIGQNSLLTINSDPQKAQSFYNASTQKAKENSQNNARKNELGEKQQRETKYVQQYGMPPNNDLSQIPVDESQWPIRG